MAKGNGKTKSLEQQIVDRLDQLVAKMEIGFEGLNAGLVLMMVTNLIPGGIVQLTDVLRNGYWHARRPEFLQHGILHTLEWARLPGDVIFIAIGTIPLLLAVGLTYLRMKSTRS